MACTQVAYFERPSNFAAVGEQADEDFLRGVVGVLLVAQQAIANAPHALPEPIHQRNESDTVGALAGSLGGQLFVGPFGHLQHVHPATSMARDRWLLPYNLHQIGCRSRGTAGHKPRHVKLGPTAGRKCRKCGFFRRRQRQVIRPQAGHSGQCRNIRRPRRQHDTRRLRLSPTAGRRGTRQQRKQTRTCYSASSASIVFSISARLALPLPTRTRRIFPWRSINTNCGIPFTAYAMSVAPSTVSNASGYGSA